MKSKYYAIAAVSFPLVIIIVLAVMGITLDIWVYVVLAVVCPAVVGLIWYFYKDAEKKVTDVDRENKGNEKMKGRMKGQW